MHRLTIAFAFLLALAALGGARVHASPRAGGVDVSNKPIQFQAARQDPINHQITPLTVPLDLLPAQARDVLTTPVDTGLNSFWSSTAVPFLCKLAQDTLNGQGPDGTNLYGTTCGFAPAGRVTATAQDNSVVLSFFLPQNVIQAWVTTPGTCADGHGTIFCPTDPHVSLTADFELQATIQTPGPACDAHIDPFSVHASNVKLDSQNLTADIAFDVASLWASLTGTDYVTTAENFIESGVDQMNHNAVQMQKAITSQVAAFTSGLCNAIIPHLPGATNDFWLLNSSVDPNQGIVFQLLDQPPSPSIAGPMLTAAQQVVVTGDTVQLSGQFFPPNGGTVTLTLGSVRLGTATLSAQGTFTTTVAIPAAIMPGNASIRATAGTAQAQAAIQVVAPGGRATLVVREGAQTFTTLETDGSFDLSGTGFPRGPVDIYLDSANGPRLWGGTASAGGTFAAVCQVSSDQINRKYGPHTLVAVANGSVQATLTLTFVPPEVIH
ncbi:MAG: hypothetical protein M3021_10730 [Actinomycetota bacterium]|nr:hypothetical protein [Actinomycetota bacterium]